MTAGPKPKETTMTHHTRPALRAAARVLTALAAVTILTNCDSGTTEAPETGLETAAAGRNSLPDAGAGLSRDLPAADELDRDIPGIAVLTDPTHTARPEPEPAPRSEPEPAPTTAPQPEPEPAPTTAPQPEPEPAPTTAPQPEPEPEPEPAVPHCEGYRVEDLLFESGSAELAPEAAASFDALVALIPAQAEVVVVGHTDSVPAPMGNQKLSELRAQAVADAMAEAGLPSASIIEVVGRAETEPVATNETPEGRRQNRRVEVFVNCPFNDG